MYPRSEFVPAFETNVRPSLINFHSLVNAVVLENQEKSPVLLWTPKLEEGQTHPADIPLKFSTAPDVQENLKKFNREHQLPIYGILGVFQLLSGWFIVLITERTLMGHIEDNEIYLATKCIILPIPTHIFLLEEENKIQQQFLSDFQNTLDECKFYYSETFDLTHSAQRRSKFTAEDLQKPLWRRADSRFFWNRFLMGPFIEHGISDWILTAMDGFVAINRYWSTQLEYTFTLISRRECYRTGARFQTRGADPAGNVANFAETEQIIEFKGNVSSWVQTRGSIPLIWYQFNALKAKPTVDHSPFSSVAFWNHMNNQVQRYGRNIIVSLIDQKGNEQDIGEEYEANVRMLDNPNVRYIAFDFHEECKNNNYSKLQALVTTIERATLESRYFLKDMNGKILCEQTGNIRTNCIDCLDRTNVAQSQFGRFMLKEQLANLGLISKNSDFDRNLLNILNNVWANNADTLSTRYTGVGALKTDFTRTGKRSAKGAVEDGVKSITRMYKSTFSDSSKQDTTEFLLGKFSLKRLESFNLKDALDKKTYNVIKKTNWEDKGKPIILILDFVNFLLITYSSESAICKQFPISELLQISRYYKQYRSISLVFASSAVTKKFTFQTIEEKENFLIQLDAMKTVLRAAREKLNTSSESNGTLNSPKSTNSPRPPPPAKITEESLKIYIGTVNITTITDKQNPNLADSIPKDRDLYVICAQNCHYPVPKDYYFSSCVSHWCFLIRKYLGPEFSVVKIASVANRFVSMILIRKQFEFRISNIDVSHVVMSIPRNHQKVEQPQKLGGFGGLIKSITSEVKKISTAETDVRSYNPSDYIGIAISCTVNETSLCFVNMSYQSPLPIKVLDMDIANFYHHVFYIGDINPTYLDSQYWIVLTESPLFGCIFWRTLLNSNLDRIVGPKELSPAKSIPVNVCFQLRTILHLPANCTKSAKITIYDISADDLIMNTALPPRLLNTYAHFHSPLLSHSVKTTVKYTSWSPVWEDMLLVSTVPTYKEYLATRHLIVHIRDQTDGSVGSGILNLKAAVENPNVPQDWACRITLFDEPHGIVRGKVVVTFDDNEIVPVKVSQPLNVNLSHSVKLPTSQILGFNSQSFDMSRALPSAPAPTQPLSSVPPPIPSRSSQVFTQSAPLLPTRPSPLPPTPDLLGVNPSGSPRAGNMQVPSHPAPVPPSQILQPTQVAPQGVQPPYLTFEAPSQPPPEPPSSSSEADLVAKFQTLITPSFSQSQHTPLQPMPVVPQPNPQPSPVVWTPYQPASGTQSLGGIQPLVPTPVQPTTRAGVQPQITTIPELLGPSPANFASQNSSNNNNLFDLLS